MDKKVLNQYIDACELIKETELELERLNGMSPTMAVDKVSGSMQEFPYVGTSFRIEGAVDAKAGESKKRMQMLILQERRDNAKKIKMQVEHWLNGVPVRIQRIIRYKYFENLSWEEVADKIGRNSTGDGVRMELDRYFRKK